MVTGLKTVIVIPTYNERENIALLLDRIASLRLENFEIIVVDDDSPDGTWKVVEEKAKDIANLHLLKRCGRRGRGLAGMEGFRYALGRGADYIIEMDADFSHDPSSIPALLQSAARSDVVLGSRFVPGGASLGRSFLRRCVTNFASFYIRRVLSMRVSDPTSGFRCFRRKVLESIDISTLSAKGPFIVTELLWRCHRKGFSIAEVPITFRERLLGDSKLGFGMLLRNLIGVLKLRFARIKGLNSG